MKFIINRIKNAFVYHGQKPFSVGSLTEKQTKAMLESKKLGCGLDKLRWLFSVQDLFFSKIVQDSCRKHDIYYSRRGNLWDKIKGDWYF